MIHARWASTPGKLRKTISGIGHVVWNDAGSECQIYIPGRAELSDAPGIVQSLSDYVGETLVFISAETLALVMTRPETLETVPPDCVAVQVSKWNTGIGWFEAGRILDEEEVETAWNRIMEHIGSDKARWHTYAPEITGYG